MQVREVSRIIQLVAGKRGPMRIAVIGAVDFQGLAPQVPVPLGFRARRWRNTKNW